MATTREERTIILEVISATDLKKVKTFGKQDAYAVAYVYPQDRKSTTIDTHGALNPVWNSKLYIKIDEQYLQQGRAMITLEIHCKSVLGSKIIGTTKVPLSNLPKENGPAEVSAFELRRPRSGKTQGIVNVSLALGEKKTVQIYQPPPMRSGVGSSNYPVTGYPAGGQQRYPQQQPYGYPQQQPYGYPQQQYGYPQQQGYYQQPGRRPGGGLGGMGGAGLGLGAGLLGGMLVGEAIGDHDNYGGGDYGGGDYGGGDYGGGDFGGGDFGGGF